jgi:hypothetical protein
MWLLAPACFPSVASAAASVPRVNAVESRLFLNTSDSLAVDAFIRQQCSFNPEDCLVGVPDDTHSAATPSIDLPMLRIEGLCVHLLDPATGTVQRSFRLMQQTIDSQGNVRLLLHADPEFALTLEEIAAVGKARADLDESESPYAFRSFQIPANSQFLLEEHSDEYGEAFNIMAADGKYSFEYRGVNSLFSLRFPNGSMVLSADGRLLAFDRNGKLSDSLPAREDSLYLIADAGASDCFWATSSESIGHYRFAAGSLRELWHRTVRELFPVDSISDKHEYSLYIDPANFSPGHRYISGQISARVGIRFHDSVASKSILLGRDGEVLINEHDRIFTRSSPRREDIVYAVYDPRGPLQFLNDRIGFYIPRDSRGYPELEQGLAWVIFIDLETRLEAGRYALKTPVLGIDTNASRVCDHLMRVRTSRPASPQGTFSTDVEIVRLAFDAPPPP